MKEKTEGKKKINVARRKHGDDDFMKEIKNINKPSKEEKENIKATTKLFKSATNVIVV